MRKSIFSARPTRSLAAAFRAQQPRRMFATPPIKDTSPPSPIEPSKEQAHPIGPFYAAVLNDPQPIPEEKPEDPPASAAEPAKSTRGRKPKEDKTSSGESTSTSTASSPPPPSSSSSSSKTTQTPRPLSTAPSKASSPPTPTPPPDDAASRARIIFGSRLAGPAERAERLAEIQSQSRMVAGVMVPPRPDEPDNCCMSGCVNCVWDRYRDEMEEWATASAEAERRLAAQAAGGDRLVATADSMAAAKPSSKASTPEAAGLGRPQLEHGAVSMDDDGGGSESTWDVGNVAGQGAGGKITKDFWDEELYRNVPVGIREFMKQEKRLKEKHMREGTLGG